MTANIWERIAHAIPDKLLVLDKDCKILMANKAFLKCIGIDQELLIGRQCNEFVSCTDPGSHCPLSFPLEHIGETRCNIPLMGGWHLISVMPYEYEDDDESKQQGLLLALKDISLDVKMEESLQISEQNYRDLFNNAVEGIFQSSSSGRFIRVNKAMARMVGYDTPEEMIVDVKNIEKQLCVDSDERLDLLQRLENDAMVNNHEMQIRTKDGRHIWVSINVRANRNPDGSRNMLEGFVQDITERKRSEVYLRRAEKMEAIGTLAGGIAHDFNNILGAIVNIGLLARMRLEPDSKTYKDIGQILDSAERGKNLVRQILTFSRRTEEQIQPLQLATIIKETLKMLRASLPTTINIEQEIAAPNLMIKADPTQVHQVLINLCTNAADAMRQTGGTLSVALAATSYTLPGIPPHPNLMPGTYAELIVSDTGQGIGPEIAHRIFEPFFTTKPPGKGTGMGLAMVHGIVDQIGGVIFFRPRPDGGTNFHVYFPAFQGEAVNSEKVLAGFIHGKGRLLFVEDEKNLAESSKDLLEALGYEVVLAADGLEALELFKADPDGFDAVLTDMTMPRMTGKDLARELLALRPKLPIIVCTGFSDLLTPDEAKAMGIKKYVHKPVDWERMARNLAHLIDTQKD